MFDKARDSLKERGYSHSTSKEIQDIIETFQNYAKLGFLYNMLNIRNTPSISIEF